LIRIEKTVYDKPEALDGKRILVMRTWPRGVSKDKVDLWMRDLGTDRELIRKWKAGKVSWDKFAAEYKKSLKGKEDMLRNLAKESRTETITLLCTDKNPNQCHRSLLKSAIEEQLG